MQRYSHQRQAILDNVRARCDHPSADMIYEDLRKVYPNISLGTVYRNLTQLAESGEILRISDCERDRFDKTLDPHVHFICDECDTVKDVWISTFETELAGIRTELDCTINSVTVSLHGSCAECRRKSAN